MAESTRDLVEKWTDTHVILYQDDIELTQIRVNRNYYRDYAFRNPRSVNLNVSYILLLAAMEQKSYNYSLARFAILNWRDALNESLPIIKRIMHFDVGMATYWDIDRANYEFVRIWKEAGGI